MTLHRWMRGAHSQCALADRARIDFTRRRFLGTTAGATLGAGLLTSATAQNPHVDARPKPIPGGVSPFGVFIHHFPVPPPGTPLASIPELSQITDFNGFVTQSRIQGGGTGTGFGSLTFQADMGFMVGEYIGMDGKHYNGAFGFI